MTPTTRTAAALLIEVSAIVLAMAASGGAHGQGAGKPAIRQCGNLLSDRLDRECAGKEQVILNADGLQRGVAAPESESGDDRSRQLKDINQQIRLERKRKESLVQLFPDEGRHNAARLRDLAEIDRPIRTAEGRIDVLRQERKTLNDEVAIHSRGQMPAPLKLRVDRNESALREATSALADSRDERSLVSRRYDEELAMLKKLWAARPKS